MKKVYTLFLCLALLSAAVLPVFADGLTLSPFNVHSTAAAGMGGDHVAYTNNSRALFVNPAALATTRQKTAFTLSPTLIGPSLELIEALPGILDGFQSENTAEQLTPLTDFISANAAGGLPIGIKFNGLPLSIASVNNGFGWGLWSNIPDVDVVVNGTTAKANVNADLILNLGYGFRLVELGNHSLYAGVVLKGFGRGGTLTPYTVNMLDVINNLDAATEDVSLGVVAGGGIDLGINYTWNILGVAGTLSIGAAVDDVYTAATEVYRYNGDPQTELYRVPMTANVGVAYTIPEWIPLVSATIMADYRDVAHFFTGDDFTKKNPLLGVGFGAEVTLLSFLKARVGLNDWLPALGVGLKLGGFELDAAYYGVELGNEPGANPTYALDLSISIHPSFRRR